MAYSEKARELRRCQAQTKDGQPCRQYAVWGDPLRRCGAHGGRVTGPHVREKTAYEPCHCVAYPFPHRPGSGLCRWPDPPQYRLNIRPGTHATGRQEVNAFMPVGWRKQPSCIQGWRLFGDGQLGYPRWR